MYLFFEQQLKVVGGIMASARSFEDIMAELYEYKEQLIKLYYIYSPDAANYHQIQKINHLQKQVKSTKEKLSQFQSQLISSKKTQQSQLKHLQTQNQQLLSINQQLVVSNDKFKGLLQKMQSQKKGLESEMNRQRQQKKHFQLKYTKQIQNLKLIHAQELYILRKKDKKN